MLGTRGLPLPERGVSWLLDERILTVHLLEDVAAARI